ncbi:MAG: PIG-L deacetylase family protein [Anaerolineae bacterium]
MMSYLPQRAMIIMAHPDDPEFFSGGTIALWAKNGAEIAYLILTSGNKGSSDPAMTPERLAETRKNEQQNAADVLGVTRLTFFDEPDGELMPALKIRQKVVKELRRFQPDAVIAPDPTRYFYGNTYINHPDHRAAGEIALGALFPATGNRMYHPELLSQGLEPHTVPHIFLVNPVEPNLWVDISAVFELKLKAILCHQSQIQDPDNLAQRLKARSKAIDEYGREVYREGYRHMTIG